jgi:hypothetical protein
MVRAYKRKSNLQTWAEENMKTALEEIQGGSNMTGTNCDLFTNKSSRSYLNHLVLSKRMGYKKAAQSFHVPQSNLEDRAKKQYRGCL